MIEPVIHMADLTGVESSQLSHNRDALALRLSQSSSRYKRQFHAYSKARVRPPTTDTNEFRNPRGGGGRRQPVPHHHNTSLRSSEPRIYITNTIAQPISIIVAYSKSTSYDFSSSPPLQSLIARRTSLPKRSPTSPIVLSNNSTKSASFSHYIIANT